MPGACLLEWMPSSCVGSLVWRSAASAAGQTRVDPPGGCSREVGICPWNTLGFGHRPPRPPRVGWQVSRGRTGHRLVAPQCAVRGRRRPEGGGLLGGVEWTEVPAGASHMLLPVTASTPARRAAKPPSEAQRRRVPRSPAPRRPWSAAAASRPGAPLVERERRKEARPARKEEGFPGRVRDQPPRRRPDRSGGGSRLAFGGTAGCRARGGFLLLVTLVGWAWVLFVVLKSPENLPRETALAAGVGLVHPELCPDPPGVLSLWSAWRRDSVWPSPCA